MYQPSGFAAARRMARYSPSWIHPLLVMRTTPVSKEPIPGRRTARLPAEARQFPFHSSAASHEPVAQGNQPNRQGGKYREDNDEKQIGHGWRPQCGIAL